MLQIVCVTDTVLLMMGCGDKSMRQVLSDFQRFFFLSLLCFSVALDSQGSKIIFIYVSKKLYGNTT